MSNRGVGSRGRVGVETVDAVMAAARVMVDVVASSLADVENQVTLSQFRILVMVGARGPMNLSAVAEHLDVHPSNATRACERLVAGGLLDRQETESDRRYVHLSLTATGRRLVESVMRRRRTSIEEILGRMADGPRRALGPALLAFDAAAEDLPRGDAEPLGWDT